MPDEEGQTPAPEKRKTLRAYPLDSPMALPIGPPLPAGRMTPPCRACGYPMLKGESLCPRCTSRR